MSQFVNVRSEFVALVNELQSAPDNHGLQQKLVHCLPGMKALASKDPLALFQLAKIYAPSSPEYRNTVRRSANQGCTNAMLELCQLLVQSGKPEELKTAAHYMKKIKLSNDSHIYDLSKALLEKHPALGRVMAEQTTSQSHRFFRPDTRTEEKQVPVPFQARL